MRLLLQTIALAVPLLLTACGDKDVDDTGHDHEADADTYSDTDADTDSDTDVDADTYAFSSSLSGGENTVSFSGQTFRHLLIHDLKSHMGGMTERLDSGSWYPVSGEVIEELEFYLEFDSDAYGTVEHDYSAGSPVTQVTYDDVSSGKDLLGKLAGNDETGQHADWSTDFVGWEDDGVSSPEDLVRHWFDVVDAQAVDWSNGDIPLDPSGAPVPAVFVDAEGRDYQQLTQKFLLGAIAFSQGADDYLDDDIEDKGLNSDHSAVAEGKPYTTLEHQWDEGFGYFGASVGYGSWSDADIAEYEAMDADGNGEIDLLTEVCWGASVNAAKRDAGSSTGVDLTAEAWEGFHGGRTLLAETAGTELTAEQMTELQAHRDQAVSAWEAALAATVVHYVNDTLQDMGDMGTEDYSFGDHAKHWSELKGFALSLQFNPRSPLSDSDFATLHGHLGTAPVLEGASEQTQADYATDLLAARELIGTAYGFDTADLGDDNGDNGW